MSPASRLAGHGPEQVAGGPVALEVDEATRTVRLVAHAAGTRASAGAP